MLAAGRRPVIEGDMDKGPRAAEVTSNSRYVRVILGDNRVAERLVVTPKYCLCQRVSSSN